MSYFYDNWHSALRLRFRKVAVDYDDRVDEPARLAADALRMRAAFYAVAGSVKYRSGSWSASRLRFRLISPRRTKPAR
jgi:hypothetical protein